jgi:ATP-dependent DNA helicase RecG
MNKFRESSINFLVSTTVIEVGVDIPDATCMIIVHPERFGLAQLHQLRGRVGRKNIKSFCFLVTDITNKFTPAYQRLAALCQTDNGFKLAEIDLEIRGPGELLGIKQSGLPDFHIFSHSEFGDLLGPAKAHARRLISTGLSNEHDHLHVNKNARFS